MEPRTISRWRNRLPHWEIENGSYFITIRCQGSLPLTAQRQIREIKESLEQVVSNSDEFDRLQRRIFLTAEKYLDRCEGFAPFLDDHCCQSLAEELDTFAVGWQVRDWVIMPNHMHLFVSDQDSRISLSKAIRQFKGRSARNCNQTLGRSGPFWQRDWFDRWIRIDAERIKVQRYIANNPVKAKLTSSPDEYRWLHSELD
ncbi:transposase [Coraliomargarita parva]|uniref:transposase n=1 Tax=Coraliomargarita parva TaxID=3014050 RepID=UPI0022B334C9|nr:transposase [Coraliomargarita parva]